MFLDLPGVHRPAFLEHTSGRKASPTPRCRPVGGSRDEGLEWGRRARALGPEDPYVLYRITCLFSRVGELEEAARQFEQAVGAGFRNRRWIEMDPDLDPIRDHPRYRAAMASLVDEGTEP